MAKALKIDFGGFVEEVAEAVVKEATLDLHSKLKLYEAASRGGIGTPVDSGVLIGNWQRTMDSPGRAACSTTLNMQSP